MMSTIKVAIIGSDTSSALELQYADAGVQAGFPSPAQDFIDETIDLNRHLVAHPASTFYARVVGHSMSGEGIDDGDLLVIDKSLEPTNGDLAVCCLDGEFTLKRLRLDRRGLWLIPSNPEFRPIQVTEDNEFAIWGIVTYTIKSNRRPPRSRWSD